MAVVDYFLKIDGISGESTDAKHKGEIEVESFSWGVRSATLLAGSGAAAGRAQFTDFTFRSMVSRASPGLFLKCATGQHIKEAVLVARKAGEQPVEFLKVTLSDVLVSSYQDGASDIPTDNVKLHYRSLQLVEGPQQRIGIAAAAAGVLSYDPKTNSYAVSDQTNGVLTAGTAGGVVSRGVAEFDVSSFIGLLTAPFSTATLHLGVTEVRSPASDGGATIASADAVTHTRPGRQKPGRFDVILYTPADLTLTTDDLTRKGGRIGTITVDPNADPASLTIDLTHLEQRRQLSAFGIRLQSRGVRIPALQEEDEDENDQDVEQNAGTDAEDDPRTVTPVDAASFLVDLIFDSA